MSILKETRTIQDREKALERTLSELRKLGSQELKDLQALDVIAPAGFRPVVELLENGRKKRRSASAGSWSPETGEIRIYFEPSEPAQEESLPDSVEVNPMKAEFRCWKCGKLVQIKSETATGKRIVRFYSCGHIAFVEKTEVKSDKIVSLAPVVVVPGPDQTLVELLKSLEEAENTPGRMFVALKWFRDEYLPSNGLGWAQNHDERQAVLAKAIRDGWILTGKVHNPKAPLYPTTTIRMNRQKKAGSMPPSRFRPVPISGEPLSRTILQDRGAR